MIVGRLICALVACLVFGSAAASVSPRQTLEEKAAAADVVLIGRVRSIGPDERTPGDPSVRFVRFEVQNTLKGSAGGSVTARIGSSMPERNPDCCKIRHSYLLFLKKNGDQYVIVNPPFGVEHLGKLKATRE